MAHGSSLIEDTPMPSTQLPSTLVQELRNKLRAKPNPKRAASAAAYMKVALPFLGIAVPEVRKIAKASFRAHPIATLPEYQAFLKEMFLGAKFQEERYAALAIAGEKRCLPFQRAKLLPLYKKLIIAASWWDLVDDLSCRVGEALLADPQLVDAALRRWANDTSLWVRRTSIICQRQAKQKTDVPLLYACIEPSLESNEFFLQKAIGWALRSLAYEDPREVARYVRAHAGRLSPLSRREALKHQ